METNNTQNKLTCEQVYNLWSTDPDLIRIFDVRSKEEFNASHIPGAIYIESDKLLEELKKTDNRLAVIVAPDRFELDTSNPYEIRTNYIYMRDCNRWVDLEKPTAGHSINSIIKDLKKLTGENMTNDTLFYQLFENESSTYTYIIADKKTKEAAIIDPVLETVDRDLKLIKELGLKLIYILDTHIHADHITGAGELRKHTSAKTAVSADAKVSCVDIPLEDGQELLLGNKKIKVIATPGHTNTCMTFYYDGMLFTGDSLMIRGCGRTDFQQGSSENMYESVHNKLFKLPDETVIFPGHDYRGFHSSTIEMEKKYNPRLAENRSKEDFMKIMSELKLANPKKIHIALPANIACGLTKGRMMHPQMVDGMPEVTCEDVFEKKGKVRIVDVRRPEEFNGELGHIEGAELVTLGPDLTRFLEKTDRDEEIIFVCRSGGRSGAATAESIKLGYDKTINMAGGMLRWNDLKQNVERN